MDIISADQSTFLPLRFILDNIILTHETIGWAKFSKQALIFLKLDFTKAFDMVDWAFLSRTMAVMGFPRVFISMSEMLFQKTQTAVKVNGTHFVAFPIGRGVRQGCPFAPYLFIIIAEVLNTMVKNGVEGGSIKGITLRGGSRQQVIAQFADDSSSCY